MAREDIEKMQKEQNAYSKTGFGRWSWFSMIEKLADSDITKFDLVCEQNFIGCLNLLSFWKERDAENKRISDLSK